MAESSSILVSPISTSTHQDQHSSKPAHQASLNAPITSNSTTTTVIIDKTLASAANLVKLLPCATVIAFQALSPSFTNSGACQYTSNKYLTTALIALCALSCCFFSFTDSFIDCDGKLYYGIATLKGLYIFNINYEGLRPIARRELDKYRITFVDLIHALLSCLVFLSLAMGDPDVQSCFFGGRGDENTKEWLVNIPLGVGFLSSLVFVIFPSSRKGIGYSDHSTSHRAQ